MAQGALIQSKNGQYQCKMQDDGNLVCYAGTDHQSQHAFWASNTGGVGHGPFRLTVQNDGNTCVYDSTEKCTWSTNTWKKGNSPYHLVMQDDRNLVLYDHGNAAIWASGTNL